MLTAGVERACSVHKPLFPSENICLPGKEKRQKRKNPGKKDYFYKCRQWRKEHRHVVLQLFVLSDILYSYKFGDF